MKSKFAYPQTRREDIVDDFHGTPIPDPYRWLEEDSEESDVWIAAQNQLTADYIAEISARPHIHNRLNALWNYPKHHAPAKYGDTFFTFYNDGLKNQPVLYKSSALNGEKIELLDPNALSDDGTTALTAFQPSDDGKLMIYGLSYHGSDWQELFVRDVETGEDYDEVLKWSKFTRIAWLPDSTGFYYSRYPEPDPETPETLQQPYFNKLYLHKVGTPQSEDELIYKRPDAKELNFAPIVTDDGTYLVLWIFHGSVNRNRIYYRRLDDDGDFTRLIDEPDAQYSFLGNDGTTFYFNSNHHAPRGQIIAIDLEKPEESNWRVLIPESEDTLRQAEMVSDHFVLVMMHNAHHQVKIYDLKGNFVRDVPLPPYVAVERITGKRSGADLFIEYVSYLCPRNVTHYDFKHDKAVQLYDVPVDFSFDNYETTQVWYPSKDGTQVSMFLTHRKNVERNGQNPVLLYGYGGFSVPKVPEFEGWILNWLELGGIMAVANLRGGSEYGEEWHSAGVLENKQNVFDDFIAAGEYLVKERYTNPEKLAIMGRSNGGLLVAVCMQQRPDLFGAVICIVPVTDMLRYHKFTAGRFWTYEYGNAEENPEHFEFMIKYSPLHNTKDDTTYPPMLVTTANKDDRVVPMHAKKFTAAIQYADSGANPILLRLDMKSGHGLGKPLSKWIDEWTDIQAFLVRTLKMDV